MCGKNLKPGYRTRIGFHVFYPVLLQAARSCDYIHLYRAIMCIWRTNELASNPASMTGSHNLALSLLLLALIRVPC
jgi:hypothetical protein